MGVVVTGCGRTCECRSGCGRIFFQFLGCLFGVFALSWSDWRLLYPWLSLCWVVVVLISDRRRDYMDFMVIFLYVLLVKSFCTSYLLS